MNKTQRAVTWLHDQHGWQNDNDTLCYVDHVLSGYAANNYLDQSLIIAAGSAAGYW